MKRERKVSHDRKREREREKKKKKKKKKKEDIVRVTYHIACL